MPDLVSYSKGLQFMLEEGSPEAIFTPEDFNEEQIMIRDTVRQFVNQDHLPLSDRLENGEHDLNRDLLKKLGDLGLLGTHMPEEFGGMAMGMNTNSIIAEELGITGAFSTTFGAHTGIGMLPILYFGTEDQKSNYLPDLISGEKVACYCLTEPGSGSDALAAKTRADLSEDGSQYILNGQKMWISNAGFADIFIVFAKVGGTAFSCFILEKGMDGIKLAAEEKKLGIKGSSTRQVFFENVAVPTSNLLGQVGKGHHIAFNVLNTGRFKIGPAALGGTKGLAKLSIQYANERIQFGRQISSFGAIQMKLAEQAMHIFSVDSAVYRTSGMIQDHVQILKDQGVSYGEAKLTAAEEFVLESSILKIAATDVLNQVADECVQVHGGMGYSEETGAARGYRDARIAMIYEGTNEINRLLMASTIFKRALKGDFNFAERAKEIHYEIESKKYHSANSNSPQDNWVANTKKIALWLLGSMGQKAMKGELNLKEEQQVLLNLADILISLYLCESSWLRIQKIQELSTETPFEIYSAIADLLFHEHSFQVNKKSVEIMAYLFKSDQLNDYIESANRYSFYPQKNTILLKRKVAEYLIDANSYVL